jgi:hypothetical protein
MGQIIQAVLSGPADNARTALQALVSAGLRIVTDKDGEPLTSSWGHHDSHIAEWDGARYQKGDIDALDEVNPDHGHAVGDIVRGTGKMVPVPVPHVVAFVTVEGENVNDAAPAVESIGWRERGRWNVEPTIEVGDGLSPEQRLARVDADMSILRQMIPSGS